MPPLDYHRRLLDDPFRIDAYDRALRALVQPGMVVVDLGTGTGILAMLAARLGARVHAVGSTSVADLAEQLIGHNGLGDRIVLHRADATSWTPPQPVDLVFGDWMGRFVVDDGMLDTVAASAAWLAPGGKCCPGEIEMYLAPAGDFHVPMTDRWRHSLLGLDLSPALGPALDHLGGEVTSCQLAIHFVLAPWWPPANDGYPQTLSKHRWKKRRKRNEKRKSSEYAYIARNSRLLLGT